MTAFGTIRGPNAPKGWLADIESAVIAAHGPCDAAVEVPCVSSRPMIIDADLAAAFSVARWHIAGGGLSRKGYAARYAGGARLVFVHRLVTRADPGFEVDHVNGDRLDNRRANLRVCTRAENLRNRRKTDRDTTSRFKGVIFIPRWQHWTAVIRADGRAHYLGAHPDEVSAALAYDEQARRLHGAFACLNFPSPGERSAI